MTNDLNARRVLVAVSGGIAAYKVVEVVRRLLKRGAEVRVMMTRSATRFLHPTTFAAITGRKVGLELFSETGQPEVDHLEMPHWADVVLVAPATANLIAKMAAGLADDLVSTSLLAAQCPVIVAPAMNSSMYLHPATQANMKLLRERGVTFVGPDSGQMAAPGEKSGPGRMSEPDVLEAAVADNLLGSSVQSLAGKRVLLTAGRTEEPIDAVRVITNRSSGRMGVELAKVMASAGAEVLLVHGLMDVTPPAGIRTIPVRTALEMLEAVKGEAAEADVVFYVAAVSDWRPKSPHEGKLKRETLDGPPVIEMVENPDIAAETAKLGQGLKIGFALEASDDIELARGKLMRKRLHAILFNTVSSIGASSSELTWIDAGGTVERSGSAGKAELARWILAQTEKALHV